MCKMKKCKIIIEINYRACFVEYPVFSFTKRDEY